MTGKAIEENLVQLTIDEHSRLADDENPAAKTKKAPLLRGFSSN